MYEIIHCSDKTFYLSHKSIVYKYSKYFHPEGFPRPRMIHNFQNLTSHNICYMLVRNCENIEMQLQHQSDGLVTEMIGSISDLPEMIKFAGFLIFSEEMIDKILKCYSLNVWMHHKPNYFFPIMQSLWNFGFVTLAQKFATQFEYPKMFQNFSFLEYFNSFEKKTFDTKQVLMMKPNFYFSDTISLSTKIQQNI